SRADGTASWTADGDMTEEEDSGGSLIASEVVGTGNTGSRTAASSGADDGNSFSYLIAVRGAATSGGVVDNVVRLSTGGVLVGDNKANGTNWPTTETTRTYGGPTDTWGRTWSASEVNALGVALG